MDTLKYYKYDVVVEKMIELGHFSDSSEGYKEIDRHFADIGYVYLEESGRISREIKSTEIAEEDLRNFCLRSEWFPEAVKKLSLADVLHVTDLHDITEKYCNGINARYTKTSLNDYRYLTFDLTRENYKDNSKSSGYGNPKYKNVVGFAKAFSENNWSDSYAESFARNSLTKSLEKHGFVRVQNSMFVSKKKLTDKEFMAKFKAICEENPKLYQYAKEIHASIRGQNLDRDMLNIVKGFKPSQEIQKKLQSIREDLFLYMNIDKNTVYCYAHDKENNKFYKYKLTSDRYGVGSKAFSSISSLSVDIMDTGYSKFRSKDSVQEISREEYVKAGNLTRDAFGKILAKDSSYSMDFTRENMSILVDTLLEPTREERKAKTEEEKAIQGYVEKEFKTSYVPLPMIEDFKVTGNRREKFFDALAEAYNKEVLDKSKRFLGTHQESVQQYVNIPVTHNIVVPRDCTAIRYFNRNFKMSELWSLAYDTEENLNPKSKGVAVSIVKLPIPDGINPLQAQEMLYKFSKSMFSDNGHIAEYYLQCEKDNGLKMRGVVIVSNRRLSHDKFVEKKGMSVVDENGNKQNINVLYGVVSLYAKKRLRDCWLETLEDVMNEKQANKVRYMYRPCAKGFLSYVDKLKKEHGKKFDKRKVSVKHFVRSAWREKMKVSTIPMKGINLEENLR